MKRINIFAGHYGSGKTNIAVNFALGLAEKGLPVSIADLDIVNPYFRTRDSEEELSAAGVHLICSKFANSNLDLPALPQDLYAVMDQPEKYAVLDIGGDDRGAFALGRLTDMILEEDNYDMFFVFNCYRPLTRDAQSALEVMREIEEACRIKFTAIINNSNIGEETTEEDVLASAKRVNELAELSGLPIAMTTVSEKVYKSLTRLTGAVPLKLQKKIT